MAYRCGPTAIGSRNSWAPISSPTVNEKPFSRPLSGNFDRIFNAFERTNAFEYVSLDKEDRHIGHGDILVNRKSSSSFDMVDCALAAQTPCSEDEDFYREKILYSQARQLFPLQEDLADWINKTIGESHDDQLLKILYSQARQLFPLQEDLADRINKTIGESHDDQLLKILYSQARQLFPLQEDLADWINKTIGESHDDQLLKILYSQARQLFALQ
ncbi:hypothetical protein O0L34_g9130 [Tuta absoluta]|nr:hypothetical protein O0L34_g9130 [Tuta absoluta]